MNLEVINSLANFLTIQETFFSRGKQVYCKLVENIIGTSKISERYSHFLEDVSASVIARDRLTNQRSDQWQQQAKQIIEGDLSVADIEAVFYQSREMLSKFNIETRVYSDFYCFLHVAQADRNLWLLI